MKFRFIAAEKAHHSLTLLCRCLRVTRGGYYAWAGRPESAHAKRDRQLKVLIRASFDGSKGRYGSPRIHEDLLEQGERVSRKRVIRLKQEEGLHARVRKRFKCTTMSDHDLPVAGNLLDRQFTAERPNQRWVGDTTEFVIGERAKLYLAAILDLYSRFIVGWAVSAVNDRHVVIKEIERALQRRCPEAGLLHHSDQGCTYASEDYQAILDAHGTEVTERTGAAQTWLAKANRPLHPTAPALVQAPVQSPSACGTEHLAVRWRRTGEYSLKVLTKKAVAAGLTNRT